MSQRALILFAHGARDPEWARPVQAVAQQLRSASPDLAISIAFLEFMTPTLAEAVAGLSQQLTGPDLQIDILPFFIAQGGHLRQEVPAMLQALQEEYPGVAFRLLPPLGELPSVQNAMAQAISRLI
jgi:sirohydrochlorin cobaltochelatase